MFYHGYFRKDVAELQKANQSDQGYGAAAIPREAKKAGTLQFGKEKAEGGHDRGL